MLKYLICALQSQLDNLPPGDVGLFPAPLFEYSPIADYPGDWARGLLKDNAEHFIIRIDDGSWYTSDEKMISEEDILGWRAI